MKTLIQFNKNTTYTLTILLCSLSVVKLIKVIDNAFSLLNYISVFSQITLAATGCIPEMNGSWSLNSTKVLDPTNLAYEVLVSQQHRGRATLPDGI